MTILKSRVDTTDYEPLPPFDERFHYLTRIGEHGRPYRAGFVISEVEPNVIDENPPDGAIFVLEGEAHVETAAGETVVLMPGDFVSFDKGVKQTWQIVKRFKAAVVFLPRD
jgi:uncharacterized cupin superfamily protein